MRPGVLIRAGLAAILLGAAPVSAGDLMPLPQKIEPAADGKSLPVGRGLRVGWKGVRDERLSAAVDRLLDRWEARTGKKFSPKSGVPLTIDCAAPSPLPPALGEDESYALDVSPAGVTLRSPTVTGGLRGLETLAQLLERGNDEWRLPAVSIRDAPRFPWRGLMLDVCRHWQPMAVVKRTLDGMAAVKLNVLHLHLSEDQGFRVESRTHPRLHERGSDGKFFTPEEIRAIVAYATERGIRVVPEFDLPGHATSWLVGYPELGSRPGPYAVERRWGIFDPVLDPTSEEVYAFLDGLFGEMAALFPDPYFHIGGDEVKGDHWDANPKIQAFMRERGFKSHAELQAYFNRRAEAILAKHGKRMVGWDEILRDGLPKTTVIQSWRGPASLADAARRGYPGILSNGFYIDLAHPTAPHYLNDPLPADSPLDAAQRKRILGGEATMWTEWVTPETIDSRIWPRAAAIAERLWSPAEVRDVDDMHRRLPAISARLAELGLTHESYVDPLLARLAGTSASPEARRDLRLVADLVEPVEGYLRGRQQPGSVQSTPLDGLVDASRPDSAPAREFSRRVDRLIFASEGRASELLVDLRRWQAAARRLRDEPPSPRLAALRPLFERLDRACAVGLDAGARLGESPPPPTGWASDRRRELAQAAKPHDACKLPFIPALRRLVVATADWSQRSRLSSSQWRTHVEKSAAPEASPSGE